MQSRSWHVLLRPLACCWLSFALLVLTLDAQSIWWDEGISLHLASLPWAEILQDRAANIHPPLYFLLLKAWTEFVGRTPFAGRMLSALAMTLLPAVVYRFLGRRVGSRAGRAAALLVALAPPFVIYGQETRAYALLPLGVIALWSLVWPPSRRRVVRVTRDSALAYVRPRPQPVCLGPEHAPAEAVHSSLGPFRRGILLGIVQAALIGLHYAGAIAAGVAALGYGLRWMRERRRRSARGVVREWLTGAVVTLICLAPWAAAVVGEGLGGLRSQAGIGNTLSEPAPAAYVASLLGIFHTTGLPEALGAAALVRVGVVIGGLIVLGSLAVLLRGGPRSAPAALLLLWLVPFCGAPIIWALSPQSHPRYLFAFVVGGWLVAAILVTHRGLRQVPRWVLLATLLSSDLLALHAYFTDPAYARSDVRAAAAFIGEQAVRGDVALVPYSDWSLSQYDLGAAKAAMVPTDASVDDALVSGTLLGVDGAVGGPGTTIFVLDYQRGALDPRRGVRAALAWGGVLVAREPFHGIYVERYEMTEMARVGACEPLPPVCLPGQDLCLVGAAYRRRPVSGAALPVALCWAHGEGGTSPGESADRYAVGLRLYGRAGDLVAGDNALLVDAALRPTDQWPAQDVVSYHLVPVPVGALPAPYVVQAGLFEVQTPDLPVSLVDDGGLPVSAVSLGETTPVVSPWRDVSLSVSQPLPDRPVAELSASLRLAGAHLDRDAAFPGQTIYVAVSWQVTGEGDGGPTLRLVLRQGGQALSQAVAAIAFGEMPVGRPLLETFALRVPPAALSGVAEVVLISGHETVLLGDVEILGGEHTFDVPSFAVAVQASAGDVATLLGVDLAPGTVITAGHPLTLTLIWRAEGGAAGQDLKVFTHLVSESGDLLAQHDGQPADWTRPTPGWLAGEVIRDTHVLTWPSPSEDTPVESGATPRLAELYVGLYDGLTGERLLWQDGRDALHLPIRVTVVGAPEGGE